MVFVETGRWRRAEQPVHEHGRRRDRAGIGEKHQPPTGRRVMLARAGLACLLMLAACSDGAGAEATASSAVGLPDSIPLSAATPDGPLATSNPADARSCEARREAAKKLPALPGAQKFEERRVHFARVRGRALLWRREPKSNPSLPKLTRGLKRTSVSMVNAVKNLQFDNKSEERWRQVVLSEGYLWSDDVLLGLALTEQVSLTGLYEEKQQTLFVQRGVDIYELKREAGTKLHKERYVYKGGAFDGEKAEILLGDRVGKTREELIGAPPLVVDLQDLVSRSSFDRIRPTHLTEDALVADVRYGKDTWVPALFSLSGARAELACEVLSPELAKAKAKFLESRAPLRAAMLRVRAVVRKMVREEIPFDADPNQSNGYLRKAWLRAYMQGWRTFTLEEKSNDVYSPQGQPKPPQVCIDFLTDTWERASGTWYQAAKVGDQLEPKPKRTQGAIDFDKLSVGNRRSVAEFTKFTQEHEDLFEVWELAKSERIPFKKRDEFFEFLHKKADMILPGDMLTVHGFKGGGRPHYHSLIVLEQDPITGVPTLVAGNAVFPREQTLEGIMHISPKRSLRHRIRVRDPWLKAIANANDEP